MSPTIEELADGINAAVGAESERILNGAQHRLDQRIAARAVLGALLGEGPQPGGFTSRLVEAATHADQKNQAKLALGFPYIVEAVMLYQSDERGIEILRERAA